MRAMWRSQAGHAQSGQALVEYVLLLVVVVAVILGTLFQFNMAVKAWANSYFGDYLSCLLETGELPSLGGPAGTCNSQFQAFSLANGRPLVATNSSSSSSNSNSNSSKSSSTGNSQNGNGNLTMIPSNGIGSSSGSPSQFMIRPPGHNGKNGSESFGGDSVADLSGYDKDKVIRIPIRAREGYIYGGASDQEKDRAKIPIHTVAIKSGDAQKSQPQLIQIQRNVASKIATPEISPITFGNILRYLIIAAILLAIIIFIGGQVVQVTKSME